MLILHRSNGFMGQKAEVRLSAARQVATMTLAFAALTMPEAVFAHGITGNRFFPGTLTFDDPAVADEAIVPNFSNLNHPAAGEDVTDNRINWSFTRLLTPTVGFVADSSWNHRSWVASQRSGFDVTSLGLKWEMFRDNPHETLVSASLTWGVGNSGAQGVGANAPNTIRPGISFGKGFGDLPEALAWFSPFGVTAPDVARPLSSAWSHLLCRSYHAAARKKRRATIPRAGAGIAATFLARFHRKDKDLAGINTIWISDLVPVRSVNDCVSCARAIGDTADAPEAVATEYDRGRDLRHDHGGWWAAV